MSEQAGCTEDSKACACDEDVDKSLLHYNDRGLKNILLCTFQRYMCCVEYIIWDRF